jgi:hypothetical protein
VTTVLPSWIDEVKGVDFTPETDLLRDLEQWADASGWEVSDGKSLPSELRQRTDVLLTQPGRERRMRVVVLPKTPGDPGVVRIDATSYQPFIHRVFELVYQPAEGRWRVEAATIPLSDDIRQEGWDRLANLAFRL